MRITDGRPQSQQPLARTVCNDSLNTPSARHQFKATGLQYSAASVDANPIHWQPLFCPAYVLEKALQTGSFQNKWRERGTPGFI
jgi:hypothetical protein